MIFDKIKADTPEPQPHVIPVVEKQGKMTTEWQEQVHTSIIPVQAIIDSTM